MTRTHTYRGYRITQGSYTGTSDDCAGRWYATPISADCTDRRGPGVRRLADIKGQINDILAEEMLNA